MRAFLALLSIFCFFLSCKNDPKNLENTSIQTDHTKKHFSLTVLEKIANSHGIKKWTEVNEIQFTFNVDRGDSHYERNWSWKPKLHKIKSIIANDTISYVRSSKIDSSFVRTDKGFINDKYWLLAPFNLVWDRQSFNYTHDSLAIAPISKKKMQKITIVYKNEGGYTPGDAYDLYFEDDFLIKEWAFRKKNSTTSSLITSWKEYQTYKGLKVATNHSISEGNWKLYFTDITVK